MIKKLLRSIAPPPLAAAGLALLALSGLESQSHAQVYPSPSEFSSGVFPGTPTNLPYRYLAPNPNNPSTKYPLVVFLHGQGERGTDNTKQLNANCNGAMIFVSKESPDNQENHPCYFLAPQCPSEAGAWDTGSAYVVDQVYDLVTHFINNYNVDPNRIYITGLSSGGGGTTCLLNKDPSRWAAAAVVCGWAYQVGPTIPYYNVPLWSFHCANDPEVHIPGMDGFIANARASGATPIYTRYDAGGHEGGWIFGYSAPPLVDWMFSQEKGTPFNRSVIPNVQITSPTAGTTYQTSGNTVSLAGTAGDAVSLKWINYSGWTGSDYPQGAATGTTAWNASNVPLNYGANKLAVLATGPAYGSVGNGVTTYSAPLLVTQSASTDTIPPSLTITNPSGTTYSTSSTPLNLSGVASDNVSLSSITWTNSRGGSGSAAGSNNWTITGVPLLPNLNVITVTATDSSNLTTTRTVNVTYTGAPANQPPVVSAGSAQTITLPATAALNATVSDDGLPTGSTLTRTWSGTGPGTVSFNNATLEDPIATFSAPGSYVLTLTVSDSAAQSSATVTITVNSPSGNWIGGDIGNPTLSGTNTGTATSQTIQASGADIWGTSDQFRFVYQTLNGDGTIVAKVDSLSLTDPWAKAGVMIRSSLAANAPNAMMCISPSSGAGFMCRSQTGSATQSPAVYGASIPQWVKVVRTGSSFSGYISVNGSTWTQISTTVTIPMGTQVYVGLAVTSHTNAARTTAVFSDVDLSTPTTWSFSDIGGPSPAGSTNVSGTTYTLQAGGSDIWAFSDQFHFASQPLIGDGVLVAHVDSLTNTNPWAKAAVMIRGSLAANSAHAMMCVSPTSGVGFMYRPSNGSNTIPNVLPGSPVNWISIRRVGSTFRGYVSSDGSTWNLVGQATFSLPQQAYVGLALTSHEDGALTTGVFSGVSLAASSNLALNMPTTASSTEAGGANVAINGTDGLSNTRWSSAASNNEWIQVDLGSSTPLNQATLTWETAYGKNYVIEGAASSGGPWTILATQTNGIGGTDTLPLSGSWRYVRMRGTLRGTNWGYSLWEFALR